MKERILFVLLVLALLVPLWTVERIPTNDGPCHVYNAWIDLQLGTPGANPVFARYYEVDRRPATNWLTHQILRGLLPAFGPLTAEKLLASLYVLLFALGAWYLAGAVDPDRRWTAFLALPFILSWPFHYGFYNFCLSLPFYLLAVGCWWRNRDRPGLALFLKMGVLLGLCFLAHIISAILALLTLGVLWLATLPAGGLRRQLLHVPILAPHAVPPLWFILSERSATLPATVGMGSLWQSVSRLEPLFVYTEAELGGALAAVFLAAALFTLARRRLVEEADRPFWRAEDGFLFASLVLLVFYFVSPDGMSGGSLMKNRFIYYPYLVLLPWLAPPFKRRGRALTIGGVALLTLWNVVSVTTAHRAFDREFAGFLELAREIEPGSRVVAIAPYPHMSKPGPVTLQHAIDRVAVERELVDWANYMASCYLFPVKLRVNAVPGDPGKVAYNFRELDDRAYGELVDYVYTWRVPPGTRIPRSLERGYALVEERGPGRLYARREPPAER